MKTLPVSNRPASGLADSLTRIASDLGRTRHLHEILGDYCHQGRNLLNCLKMSLYLTRRGIDTEGQGRWVEVESQYQVVERLLDRIQLICRPMPIAPVRLPLSLLFDDRKAAWEEAMAARGRLLIMEPPDGSTLGAFDPLRFGQGFDELVAWRAREGTEGSPLRVRWRIEDDGFRVVWDEPLEQRASTHLPAPAGNDLTAALLTRIVTLHGGRLELADRRPWWLCLRWPLDATTHVEEAPRC